MDNVKVVEVDGILVCKGCGQPVEQLGSQQTIMHSMRCPELAAWLRSGADSG